MTIARLRAETYYVTVAACGPILGCATLTLRDAIDTGELPAAMIRVGGIERINTHILTDSLEVR